ncbi:MAG TPA: class I SAM-dependent methyltransferase [Bdellovibrionales bacterium]|nr:class I SAM-dependent methyltransferase [Bdellovibrionales bacterium]
MSRLPPFDKYKYYRKAVQAPDTDAEFLYKTYKHLKGRPPKTLREDFCGTFAISCEWVKQKPGLRAFGVDLDPEPLAYGRENYYSKLEPGEQRRLEVLQKNVLDRGLPRADIVAVFNFSCYFFKQRQMMLDYFKNAHRTLNPGGLFVIDSFGGPLCEEPNTDEVKHRGFIYYWDQTYFEPIHRDATFFIHFKRKGERKREKVFRYDWRMWTLPELRDLMADAGFRKTHVFWEGSTKSGAGNGEFRRREKGDDAGAWVAYVIGEK